MLSQALVRAALTSSMILFLIATANVFGWVIIFEKVPQHIAEWLTGLTSDPFVFLLLVNVFLLGVGMVIDGIAALILVVPILLPVAQSVYGIDSIHFGVIVCINVVLGLLTPPLGAGLYLASSLGQVPVGRLFIALLPYLFATLCVLLLISWQPVLVTWLL
jgi:tripartite ATP-independent transporter DctM subunit